MRFDGIDCAGEFKVERLSSLPGWTADDEGRMIYAEDTDRLYLGISSEWRLLTKTTDNEDLTATAAEINLALDGIIATAAELNYMDGVTGSLIGGIGGSVFESRSKFSYNDANNIDINAGVYYHQGGSEGSDLLGGLGDCSTDFMSTSGAASHDGLLLHYSIGRVPITAELWYDIPAVSAGTMYGVSFTVSSVLYGSLKVSAPFDGLEITEAGSYIHYGIATTNELRFTATGFGGKLDDIEVREGGIADQLVYWDSQLTVTSPSVDPDGWNYLYLDNSAIQLWGSPLLTADEFTFSATEPTWSDSKHGYYNGNDRCIFATRETGGDIVKFYHDGGRFVEYDTHILDRNGGLGTSWTNVTLTVPDFGDDLKAFITIRGSYKSSVYVPGSGEDHNGNPYWKTVYLVGGETRYRKDGTSGGGNVILDNYGIWSPIPMNSKIVTVNSSQRIEAKQEYGNGTVTIWTNGWYLPRGM